MQSSLDSILSIQVYPVKPCMEIYQVLVSHYHLFHINDMDIIPLSSIIYNENILCRLLFLLSLRSVVLWIACGLTAFIFQHNVVCLDIPFHISPSIVGVCHRIGNRIDKLHLGIVRIIFDRDFRWDRYLYRAFLLTALPVSYTHLDVYKRQVISSSVSAVCCLIICKCFSVSFALSSISFR